MLQFPKRSFWRDRTTRVWSFFCPLCHVPRRIPYQPRPGLFHLIQIGLTAVIFMIGTWKWFEWKGIVSFLPMWAVFEMIYRSRVRAALACTQCGFDPYLYRIDLPRAREVVENHWKKKFAEKGIPYPEKPGPLKRGQNVTKPAQEGGASSKPANSTVSAEPSSQP